MSSKCFIVLLCLIFALGFCAFGMIDSLCVNPINDHPHYIPQRMIDLRPITPLDESIVLIKSDFWSGTGIIVSEDGIIVTAGHVLQGISNPTAVTIQGKTYEIIDSMVFTNADVGICRVEMGDGCEKLPAARLGECEDLMPGTDISIVGMPYGEEWWHSYGHIARIESGGRVFMDISGNPGNSGCAVFNDNGEVIGMVTDGILHSGLTMGFSIELIHSYINIYKTLE